MLHKRFVSLTVYFGYLIVYHLALSATEGAVQTSPSDSRFIETGYVYGVHGFQGEVRVKTSTDFPELRFSKVE